MKLSRYLDLYLTETQEHLRRLDQGLLDLEEAGDRSGLEDAFRAVHTIKGMSASMGFGSVADLAHDLEDRLEALRKRRKKPTAKLVDQLLADTDRLKNAVDDAVEGQAVDRRAANESVHDGAPGMRRTRRAVDAPDGTGLIVRVSLRLDAQLMAVRAVMILSRVQQQAEVLGSDPAEPGEDFDGDLTLFLADSPDRVALESAIVAAGEVEEVRFELPGEAPQAAATAERADSDDAEAGGAEESPDGGVEEASGPERDAPGRRTRRGRFLRVDLRHLDNLADGIAELAILQRGIRLAADDGNAERLAELESRAEHLVNELQTDVLDVRMVPVGEMFDRFPRVVRDAARRLDRQVEFRVEGREIELDRAILDEIADPLVHLLRNAVGHGIEPPAARRDAGKPERGLLVLSAEREQSRVLIRLSDDGRGVDRQRVREKAIQQGLIGADADALNDAGLLRVMSMPGLSTADRVTAVSGRGVGLDVVAERVRALGGSLDLETRPGAGTTFSIRLPLTLALAQALRVRVGDEGYVMPLTHVAEAVDLEEGMTARMKGVEMLRLRGDVMPLLRLGTLLGLEQAGHGAAVVVDVGERRTALAVDALMGREQIVIREFEAARGTLTVFSGATLLADGTPALVLDPVSVTQRGMTHG